MVHCSASLLPLRVRQPTHVAPHPRSGTRAQYITSERLHCNVTILSPKPKRNDRRVVELLSLASQAGKDYYHGVPDTRHRKHLCRIQHATCIPVKMANRQSTTKKCWSRTVTARQARWQAPAFPGHAYLLTFAKTHANRTPPQVLESEQCQTHPITQLHTMRALCLALGHNVFPRVADSKAKSTAVRVTNLRMERPFQDRRRSSVRQTVINLFEDCLVKELDFGVHVLHRARYKPSLPHEVVHQPQAIPTILVAATTLTA